MESFHGPVRDGKGWYQLAVVIRHDLLLSRFGSETPQPIWEEVVELRGLSAFGVTGVTWAVLVGTTLDSTGVPPSGVVLSKR